MAYCTPEDVKGELYLPLLAQMQAKLGSGLDAFLGAHIARAEDYADAILSPAFEVPVSPVPRVLTTIAAKLAAFYAMAQYSEREEISRDRRDAAREMLEALVEAGRFPGQVPAAPQEGARLRGGSDPPVFTRESLSGW